MKNTKKYLNDTKKIFWKKGTCSQAYFHILNREFGHLKESEEKASDPLSGGLMQQGYQCGMLWGATLAVGAESLRRCENQNQATGKAIIATQHLMESFPKTTKCINCREITKCNLTSKLGLMKLMLKTILRGFVNSHCFNLAKKWAPKAIQTAKDGLSLNQTNITQPLISCASEVVKKMGGNEEQIAMVAGLAGGMGLSGNACGALGAAIWMNTIEVNKEESNKFSLYHQKAKKTLKTFLDNTDSKILCSEVCGVKFQTIDEHTEFVKKGGCDKLIKMLSEE